MIDVFTRPQQTITKSLIDEIVPQQLPESVMKRVNQAAALLQPGQQGQLLRLSYAGESAYQPILSHLIREPGSGSVDSARPDRRDPGADLWLAGGLRQRRGRQD